jgi:hypothetical protein
MNVNDRLQTIRAHPRNPRHWSKRQFAADAFCPRQIE